MTNGKGEIDEFEGDMDCPFPKRAVMMMKYLLGFNVLSLPISHSLSEISPEYHEGYRIAGDAGSPKVLYAKLVS